MTIITPASTHITFSPCTSNLLLQLHPRPKLHDSCVDCWTIASMRVLMLRFSIADFSSPKHTHTHSHSHRFPFLSERPHSLCLCSLLHSFSSISLCALLSCNKINLSFSNDNNLLRKSNSLPPPPPLTPRAAAAAALIGGTQASAVSSLFCFHLIVFFNDLKS